MKTEKQSLQIADGDRELTLTYSGALDLHTGQSWFGVAVGFRMLQVAGKALSQYKLWNRDNLFVVSGHPDGGVRDAVEYVTRCVSREHYRVESQGGTACNRDMQFRWEVGDGVHIVIVRLREDFVPDALFELLDRIGTPQEHLHDQARFARLKRRLARQVWDEPLEELFDVEMLEAGMTGHA